MIEIFAGSAVLCAVAKQAGLSSSIAIDKVKKKHARSTIFQLDLLNNKDRALLYQWMQSPMLLWVRLAPVCGTASRARDIRRFEGDPVPLRSNLYPEGLPDLLPADRTRVDLANLLFQYACEIFLRATELGVLATMENPKNSYFWITCWLLDLLKAVPAFFGDFQVCMLGGNRDKWTRIMANFQAIESLNIRCDRTHAHQPWGFAQDAEGRRVWATSLESQYPTKMCVTLVDLVLQFAAGCNLKLRASSLDEDTNPFNINRRAMISAGQQPRPTKLPPLVSDFCSVAVFLAESLSQVPCSLRQKLDRDIQLHTKGGQLETIPKYSRFLRFSARTSPDQKGEKQGKALKRCEEVQDCEMQVESCSELPDEEMHVKPGFEVAFGLPWTCEGFLRQACVTGHLGLRDMGVPPDLEAAVQQNVEWTDLQMSNYRIAWCRRWMKRAAELESAEKEDAALRHPTVAEITAGKRLLLTREMLEDIGYEDVQALNLLSEGATLAGEVAKSEAFETQFKPCLATIEQLEGDSARRNQLVLQMTCSSGSEETDLQLLEETELEIKKGWAEGPFQLQDLEEGSTISRRFPLVQPNKTRMIDDFSISGVNDSCVSHNRVDLHLVDTFCAMVKCFFGRCNQAGVDSELRAKTYDLTSAYRQVPIKPSHYRYAYVSVYNCRKQCAEIYRMRTMPFGATHSVFCFFRLARCLYSLAVRGLHLLTTNFYDDFILASKPGLCESSKNSMEVLFMLTGWLFARDGKKSTAFSSCCKALGVEFDFSRSEEKLLAVANTASRRSELISQIAAALNLGTLSKQECLMLRGRLGFADSFLHGRVGKLVLKKLIDHAYGKTSLMDDGLKTALRAMQVRLEEAGPKVVSARSFSQWFIYTDASFEPEDGTGGLGGVLVNSKSEVVAWFGFPLSKEQCELFGSRDKVTIIYELELLSAIIALDLWSSHQGDEFVVHYGDNDGVRFSLVKASASGPIAQRLMAFHLQSEALNGARSWFARVPTECNLSDYPSRGIPHSLLVEASNATSDALKVYAKVVLHLQNGDEVQDKGGGKGIHPPLQKS